MGGRRARLFRRAGRGAGVAAYRFAEGEATVREVDFAFPRPVERETPVALHVGLTPGQGNPRVEVIPRDRRIFAGRRLYLDWRRCQDTGKSKHEAPTR